MPKPAEVTLPSDREVRVIRTFNAPRQLVWDAHTEPELVKKWQGYDGWDMPLCDMDVRVGGKYKWHWRSRDDGKHFEADIKAAGFATVDEWNTAVTSVSFAYSAITDNLADDLETQIAEIEKDTSIAQDLKDRMVKGLKAMIPSENNKKIVQAMIDDPAYTEKLKLLAEEGE